MRRIEYQISFFCYTAVAETEYGDHPMLTEIFFVLSVSDVGCLEVYLLRSSVFVQEQSEPTRGCRPSAHSTAHVHFMRWQILP